MKKYSIVCYLENESKNKVRYLQEKLSDITGAKASLLEWEPHLTVASGPELSDSELDNLEKEIDLFCKQQKSFELLLEGFGGANIRTDGTGEKTRRCAIWISIAVNSELHNLAQNLKSIVSHYKYWYQMPEPYNPHVTLAFRDLDQEGYEKGVEFLNGRSFQEIVTINHIALVEHLSNKDVEYKRFYFNR